jgi:hypothetical protein
MLNKKIKRQRLISNFESSKNLSIMIRIDKVILEISGKCFGLIEYRGVENSI